MPALNDSDIFKKKFRKNWARLIQKIYNVDPLICPKCKGKMRIISFIEDETVIKKILKHLNLWETRIHDPPIDKKNMFNETIIIPEYPNFSDDVFPLNTFESAQFDELHYSLYISDDYSQVTYEDEYSQLTSYE